MLESIEKKSENHKILIVETSESQESCDIASRHKCIFTNTNLKYEIGAYNHALNMFPNEQEYFMFQDSLEILKSGWEDVFRRLSKGEKMVSLCSYALLDDPCPGCGKDVFEQLFGLEFPVNNASGVLANSFYIPISAKNKLKEFGIEKLLANNKNDTYGTERILGAMAYYACGYDDLSTELGNYIWSVDRFLPDIGFTQYIQKNIPKRQ